MNGMVNPRRAPKNLQLTARDQEVLVMAGRSQFITAKDVKPLWQLSESRHHYARLGKLSRAGYLKPLVGDNSTKLGYRITKRGIEALPDPATRAKALNIKRFGYRTGYEHDRLSSEIQREFEKSPLVSNFLCEPEVRSLLASRHGKKEQKKQSYKVPDGLFHLTTPNQVVVVAVEVEISTKSENRYRKIFRELLLQPDFNFVFYLVGNHQLQTLLRRILVEVMAHDLVVQTASRRNGIYFANIVEFMEKGGKTIFHGEGSQFSLDSIAAK